ncbi:hypothetical protein K440DRAFT_317150 [Wilcoxina mikolae CBS 423.85]|nr:hypothetical protein K440DRAFT_317150 [Wilcoxina mikolae CBS 423.85]
MPPMSKTPFCSKNPATIAKSFSSSGSSHGTQGAVGEVVCPLFNSDGSQCRKKCVGNFAYRSICEHIRRAHPDNWIPKLPASPETFAKMVSIVPRNNGNNGMDNGMMHHIPVQQMRKHNIVNSQSRKSSKLSKTMDEDHYLDTMSPPSSANESDNQLPSLSVAAAAVAQSFAARGFPPYEYHDEEDMDGEHEIDEEIIRGHTETTEDEDYNNPYQHSHYPPFAHVHHHSHQMPYNVPAPRPRVTKPKQQKRKRQSTLDSTTSTTSSSSFPSRWDELIEAATTRAVVETSMPPSPPQTAQTLPSICPNTPSGQSVASSSDDSGPKVECTECRNLVGLKRAFVCTECVSGFCEPCATENGKRGVCSECRVFGARWRRLKINVRT